MNVAFTCGFKTGVRSLQSFLIVLVLWIAAAPVAGLLYHLLIVREPINPLHRIGIALVCAGSVCVAAHRERLALVR